MGTSSAELTSEDLEFVPTRDQCPSLLFTMDEQVMYAELNLPRNSGCKSSSRSSLPRVTRIPQDRAEDDSCVHVVLEQAAAADSAQRYHTFISSFLTVERPGLRRCPQDWTLVGEKCLVFISSSSKSWNHSAVDCSTRESDLLLLQDREELKLVQNSISEKGGNFWIGLNSTSSEKKWKWINGSFLNSDM
ncbi:Killer cell lectin-like receptor subfamily B member 1 [Galemys pyrenaicus]|uniref:Killer cell lectin-like receptor subfamily B member 1 n=1 Tax=Galemys pyrenaicus TaxID=202257 RepID=A0A8J5ZIE6_GALPY|nr:Killer cell lectin-like receptor subfamily B member 1 [Galemys pyrenaicus]